MAQTSDNSGMGVVLGILIAVVLAIAAYFFIQNQGGIGGGSTTNVSVEAPAAGGNDTAPAAGDAAPAQPAQ